jgi:small subunit ribosomal protein S6
VLGKRRLAYPIKHFTEGHYLLLHFKLKSASSPELENRLNISEEIIRYLLKNME